ncbi:MAG: SUMF1/EgtB/PvdO family nonheme iron enzyme [Bacteroidia bacterium]|nr:SUMF1/EgtB/PvdO family nonheme iron enzyme [Bacteroidia bacterium]
MKYVYTLIMACLIIRGGMGQSANLPGQNYALFIAVQDYAEWNDLRNPIKDAETIAQDLEKDFGFMVEILRNPHRNAIYDKLTDYQQKSFGPQDQLFIFLSGHGQFFDQFQEGYFIPQDAKLNDRYFDSYIPHARLATLIDAIPCQHTLVAIDACYSGTFANQFRGGGRGDRPGENKRIAWIQSQLKHKSRLFLTSGGKERTSDGIYHSPFTTGFLNGLRYGQKDGIVDLFELFGYFQGTVPAPLFGFFGSNEPGSNFLFIKPEVWEDDPTPPDNPDPQPMDIPGIVFVKGGTFQMGSNEGEEDEQPVHTVRLDDFYLGRHEVTIAEFAQFIEDTGYQTDADKDGGSYFWEGSDWEKRLGSTGSAIPRESPVLQVNTTTQ